MSIPALAVRAKFCINGKSVLRVYPFHHFSCYTVRKNKSQYIVRIAPLLPIWRRIIEAKDIDHFVICSDFKDVSCISCCSESWFGKHYYTKLVLFVPQWNGFWIPWVIHSISGMTGLMFADVWQCHCFLLFTQKDLLLFILHYIFHVNM